MSHWKFLPKLSLLQVVKMEECSLKHCGICRKILTDPRILPCAHSFCLKCLEVSVISKDSSNCPTCRIEFEIPEEGLKCLKKNEFIEQLNILKQSNIKCDSCTENQAVKFCLDCSCNYCSICLDHHGRIPVSKNHHLKSMRSTQDAFEFKIPTCPEHSEIITSICEDCEVLSCTRCSTLGHNNHKIRCISQYFESLKTEIEEKWRMKGEIISNFYDATDTLYDIEQKASNLKKEIQKRGEALKKIVDSIVAKLIKDVDEELMQHKKDADDVLKELKNMEAILTEQIESLKQQLDDLKYENVDETFSSLPENIVKIPKYSERFDVSLFSEISDLNTHLKKTFGTLRKAPKFRIVREIKVVGSYTSFASNDDNIYFCNSKSPKVDVFDSFGLKLKSSYNFQNVIERVSDVIVVDEMLFVLGNIYHIRSPRTIKVIKIDSLLKCQPLVIYKMSYNENFFKLTRSYCQQNILLILSNQLILLSQSGVVLKSVDLIFKIKNALQLDDKSFVVCSENLDVCVINDQAEVCLKYSPVNDCHRFGSPCFAVDNYGNIYVGQRNIFVLDRGLNFCSFHVLRDVNEDLIEMFYDEGKGILLVLLRENSRNSLLKLKI